MSRTSETSLPAGRRVPKLDFPHEAYELPLSYGPMVPPNKQWTLTVITDLSGPVLGAILYHHNTNRGSYMKRGPNLWALSLFDVTPGSTQVPDEIVRYASSKLSLLLGSNAKVRHTLPSHIDAEIVD